MNTPGFSLFQGETSIKLDNSITRAQEEEDLEDKKRREEELNKDLQNAFDDLIDDDDNTVDSSNFHSDILGLMPQNNNHCRRNENVFVGVPPEENHCPIDSAKALYEHELQKIKMLLESKTRELSAVSRIAHEEKQKREEIEKHLAISEAERERAILSKKSTHELLVECKEKCSNLENFNEKLKSEIKNLETKNNEIIGQLETCQTMLADAQQKYYMVEKNNKIYNDHSDELKRKNADERHRAEIEMMQQQLNNMNNKLDKKTLELENMNSRYKALQNSHERMLIDKSSKINELSKELAEAQKQCEQLMCKHDYSQENIRLQRLVDELQKQIHGIEKTKETLQFRLEQTTADLEAMDSVLQQNNEESFRRLSQTQGQVIGSTPLSTIDKAGKLKNELYRAVASLKEKRDEIRTMKRTLDQKILEIKNLKDEENKALVLINTYKEENSRLKNKFKLLEEELDELRSSQNAASDSNNRESNLLDEINNLKEENRVLQMKLSDYKQLQVNYQDVEKAKSTMTSELRNLDGKLKDLQVDLEEVKQERDSLKLNYKKSEELQIEIEKLKFRLEDSQKECDRLKKLYVEISNEKEAFAFELQNLRKSDLCIELQQQKDKCASLNKALQLAEIKSSEFAKILETQRISHEKDLSQLREKLEKEKAECKNTSKNASYNCSKCVEYIAECTKFEIQNLKLTNQCSVYQKEINDLNCQLDEAKNHISELSGKIVLIDEREKLIVELKAKAQQFEEYIKTQSSSGASSMKQTASEDKSIETSPELDVKFNRRQVEAKIRDEMAKIFANEIRNNEQRYKTKITQMEEDMYSLRKDLQKINMELIQRQNEVQLLKHAILSEREKTEEIMKNKDKEYGEIFEKQNVILHKSRDELKMKTQRINELLKELDERNAQIEAERQSMKAVMTQWEEQRRKSDNIKEEWENKIEEMKKIHESAIASWQTKYNSAKKTALNYKRYAEDKEEHMIKEYNRIKSEYDASLAKIEMRMKETFEKKNKEMKEAIAEVERKSAERHKYHSQQLTDNLIPS